MTEKLKEKKRKIKENNANNFHAHIILCEKIYL